jgi:hypothetical protein
MKLEFESSFLKDVKMIREKYVQQSWKKRYKEVEHATDIRSISDIKN